MRELDCDFCGARAAGAYEVIPAELDPEPGEQVRVVLCDDCRGTLDGVLDPLLARLGAAGAADGGTRRADVASDASGPGGTASPADDVDPADDGPADATDAEGDAQANARSGDPSLPADDAIILGGDEADDGSTDGDRDGGADAGTDTATAGGPTDGDGDDAADPDGEPEQFRRVMRLLGDREFPLARSDVVELAGSAYDLDRRETDRIVDYAIEKDVLEEEDGRLHKA